MFQIFQIKHYLKVIKHYTNFYFYLIIKIIIILDPALILRL